MNYHFPILTIPSKDVSEFLDKLNEVANQDFNEVIILSPFVDAHIILNFIRRCVHTDKKLIIFTRYRSVLEAQRQGMKKAKSIIYDFERKKDPTLKDRITWYVNEKLHAKCVIKNWSDILFGSQNLTEFGGLGHRGRGNYELGMFIDQLDKGVTEILKDFIEEIRKTSSRKFYPNKK